MLPSKLERELAAAKRDEAEAEAKRQSLIDAGWQALAHIQETTQAIDDMVGGARHRVFNAIKRRQTKAFLRVFDITPKYCKHRGVVLDAIKKMSLNPDYRVCLTTESGIGKEQPIEHTADNENLAIFIEWD